MSFQGFSLTIIKQSVFRIFQKSIKLQSDCISVISHKSGSILCWKDFYFTLISLSVCIFHWFPRGLFEKDKLVFSFMMCVEIMKQEEKISPVEWNFFLRGSAGMDKQRPPMPSVPFLNNIKVWNNAVDLGEVFPIFKGIHQDLTKTPVWIQLGTLEVWGIPFLQTSVKLLSGDMGKILATD